MCLTYTYPSCIKTLKKCANKEKQPLQLLNQEFDKLKNEKRYER